MKFITSLLMLILIILIIIVIGVSSIRAVSRKRSRSKSCWHHKKILESSKILLFTASILVIIKYYKMLDSLGLIKRINQEEIIAISIGLTLILFAYTLIITTSQKMRANY